MEDFSYIKEPNLRGFAEWRHSLKAKIKPRQPYQIPLTEFLLEFKPLDKMEAILDIARKEVPGLRYNDLQFTNWPLWAKKKMIALEKQIIKRDMERSAAYLELVELLKEKYPEKRAAINWGFAWPVLNADSHRLLIEAAVKNHKPVPPRVLADYPDLQI